ncbi:MAG: ATP synthase F0 subunit B [Planctomycetaceae bacterium]
MSLRPTLSVLAGMVCLCAMFIATGTRLSADDSHGHGPATATAGEAGHAHGESAQAGQTAADHASADHAEHGAHGEESHGDGHPDTSKAPLPGVAPGLEILFVFSLVLFGGFVFVARALLWKPLIAALDEREGRINRARAEAEEARAQAEQLVAEHSSRMAVVHEQVQGIVSQARKEAEQEKARIIAEAESQAKSLRDQAVAEIQAARDSALGELGHSLDGQVARAVERVVGSAV